VYTVNSSLEIDRLQVLGVDGIFTDFPELVVKK
jgi:glycerophosphoryl diester phosphodiesterase